MILGIIMVTSMDYTNDGLIYVTIWYIQKKMIDMLPDHHFNIVRKKTKKQTWEGGKDFMILVVETNLSTCHRAE